MEKTHKNKCLICLEDQADNLKKEKEVELNFSKCAHILCKDCLNEYLKIEINENKLPIKCPGEKCKEMIFPSFIMKQVDNKLMNKYLNFTLDNNKDISRCPTPDCPYGFIMEGNDPKFTCPKCEKVYCFNCKSDYHFDKSCKEHKTNEGDSEFYKLAQKYEFKQCPECKMWIERTDGCSHITCKCKFEFCYKCGAKYTSDHGACEYKFSRVESERQPKESNLNISIGESYNPSPTINRRTVDLDNTNNNQHQNNFNLYNHFSDLLGRLVNGNSAASRQNLEHRVNSIKSTIYANNQNINKISDARPTKKDGTLDLRYSVNKASNFTITPPNLTSNYSKDIFNKPLKKDGTLDMRYAVNKNPTTNSSTTGSYSTYSNYNPYNVNSSNCYKTSYEPSMSGPTKKDGTLDMRYSVNKGSSSSSNYTSAYSNSRPSSYSSYSGGMSGPVKKDGTLDMRYSVNKSSYGRRK